jgi:hypothetical protein
MGQVLLPDLAAFWLRRIISSFLSLSPFSFALLFYYQQTSY